MNWRDVVGEVGVREPVVCALSGKPVAGKHAAHIYLRAPYYVMVLANRYELFPSHDLQPSVAKLFTPVAITHRLSASHAFCHPQ